MARHLEHFGNGLVTIRDPALLEVGEMSVMQNMVYRPGDYAPQRASGRTPFGEFSSTASAYLPVRGLRDIKFDNSDHFLLAMKESTLAWAAVADAGFFTEYLTYTVSATALEAVHFNDEWFLFSGASGSGVSAQNVVTYLSSTASGAIELQLRPHGLLPNTTQVSTATGAGVWTAGATGYFEYWYTELFEYRHNGATQNVEGTFSVTGIPTTLFVNTTAMQASITIPGSPQNAGAQKWILYRGGPKSLATDQEFPTGFELARGQFGVTSTIVDGSATTGAYVAANATGSTGGITAMSGPTNIFASDNSYATGRTPATIPVIDAVSAAFPTFSVSEPVVSIAVTVEAKSSLPSGAGVTVAISNDGGTSWSDEHNIAISSPPADTVITVDPGTTWGLPFTAVELVAGTFLVRVTGRQAKVAGLTGFISIDYIQARVTSNGSVALDESSPFPAIAIRSSTVDAAIGSHGVPPRANTGDIFQGHLVTNSLRRLDSGASEKSFIRYSLPDEPDYFPIIYYLDFQTSDNDEVTNIKTLNNRLAVFMKSRVYRVNYLPTESDADFNRGICREEVSAQVGCVNTMCACTFEGADGHTEIAFVADTGIFSTNLFTIKNLTEDLEWRDIIALTNSTPIALINDPENDELLFYYKNSNSGSEHYKCLHLSYSTRHIKRGGMLKVSGPVHMRNSGGGQFADLYSAWAVSRTSGTTDIFLGYGSTTTSATAAGAGSVYRENATSIPALDSTAKLRTRRMYLAGMGNEFRMDKIFTYVASANTAQGILITPYTTLTNDAAGPTARTAQTRAWAGEKLFEVAFAQNAEGLELEIAQASNNQGHWGPQHVMLDWTNFGIQDSGKA